MDVFFTEMSTFDWLKKKTIYCKKAHLFLMYQIHTQFQIRMTAHTIMHSFK